LTLIGKPLSAQEAAISRLYGGIHYPTSIQNGLTEGQCIGDLLKERVRLKLKGMQAGLITPQI
jgi:hypothetical protein